MLMREVERERGKGTMMKGNQEKKTLQALRTHPVFPEFWTVFTLHFLSDTTHYRQAINKLML